MNLNAINSACGTYRYLLTQSIPPTLFSRRASVIAFVMLNPSKADEMRTMERCIAFTAAWGYEKLIVVNLFAVRTTDPAEISFHRSPIGPDNDKYLRRAAKEADQIVCAWGAHPALGRIKHVQQILDDSGKPLYCIGQNRDGSPKHPLYVPRTADLRKYEVAYA